MMIIRQYRKSDEREWLRCRVVSFLDCSYWNDVKTAKEAYPHPGISFVAEENGTIIGLIDIELDSSDLYCTDKGRGAIIWDLAVLQEYRKTGIAKKLWGCALKELKSQGVQYCEVWTQDDVAANSFYNSIGFQMEDSQTRIRCYAEGKKCNELLDHAAMGAIYGPEELVFDAPVSRREELQGICRRINEVRLYSRTL